MTWSPDGKSVAFSSTASNLVPGDTNGTIDVFVKNLETGAIKRITKPDGTQIDSESYQPVFSPDGSRIAFVSNSSTLAPRDIDNSNDVFVADLKTGAITWVSTPGDGTTSNGPALNNFGASDPVFSPDGTKVAFKASFPGLVPGDTNGQVDIFVKDLTTGAITRVSTAADGSQTSGPSENTQNDSVSDPVFSPDGTLLAFYSRASNLVPGDTNGTSESYGTAGGDVFIKNLITGEVTRVSTAADGTQQNLDSFDFSYTPSLSFSPDGSQILFLSGATNLEPGQSGLILVADTPQLYVKTLLRAPKSVADTYTASYSAPLTVDAAHGVLANDTGLNHAPLTVTSFSDAQHGRVDIAPDGSFTYTPDGTFIGTDSFTYQAGDGIKTGADTTVSITVKSDIELVSTAADGTQADGDSTTPVFSPNGTKIAFVSASDNLVPGATNAIDIYIKDLTTGDIKLVSSATNGTEGNGLRAC